MLALSAVLAFGFTVSRPRRWFRAHFRLPPGSDRLAQNGHQCSRRSAAVERRY